MIPTWLHMLALSGLVVGVMCAVAVLVDIVRRPQKMAVMNVVWPVTALFGTLATLWLYARYGRPDASGKSPFWAAVAKGASHCGAGCTLGDIVAEWLCFLLPSVAAAAGWHSLFADKMYAIWVVDFLFAFVLGIAFQYYAIKPMRDISVGAALAAAFRADAMSLAAWQVGMYGFMAFASLVLFRRVLGTELVVDSAEFWFMMQLAMLCGFVTAYPVNWWLIRAGVKEAM